MSLRFWIVYAVSQIWKKWKKEINLVWCITHLLYTYTMNVHTATTVFFCLMFPMSLRCANHLKQVPLYCFMLIVLIFLPELDSKPILLCLVCVDFLTLFHKWNLFTSKPNHLFWISSHNKITVVIRVITCLRSCLHYTRWHEHLSDIWISSDFADEGQDSFASLSGAPNNNFQKISVRKTIWHLEFSEHLL